MMMAEELRTRCRFFNGSVHNKKCKKNINYRSLVGGADFGWVARLPCSGYSPLRKEPVAKCKFLDFYTQEELLQQEKEFQERFDFIIKAVGLIKSYAKEKQVNGGLIHCPKCEKPLHFSISNLNGHIWAKCESKDCIQFME